MSKVDYATFENIVSGDTPDLKKTMLAFSIGAYPHLNRRALSLAVLAWRALKIKSSTAIVMHFGGYDNDPRELWEIPEAAAFIRRFCEKTDAHRHPALDPQSRALLLACGAEPGKTYNVEKISAKESLDISHEFFKQQLGREDDET